VNCRGISRCLESSDRVSDKCCQLDHSCEGCCWISYTVTSLAFALLQYCHIITTDVTVHIISLSSAEVLPTGSFCYEQKVL